MFVNREGYDKAGNNDECFWFYDNGVSLNSFWCWDTTDIGTLGSLRGSKMTTAHTQGFGKAPTQSYNGYEVITSGGEIFEDDAQVYELASMLDSYALSFSKRLARMSKLTYEIDLSSVKITPPYTTGTEASPVYAFLGFYMWQDYYVINTGIACDTKTGNWYPYVGTSRDDSAGDADYSIQKDNCVMTSTWNEAGYFVPDSSSVTMQIETKKLTDEDGVYQANDLTITTNDGTKYERRFTASSIRSFFPQANISYNNTYAFIAGLDVKNAVNSNKTENVDTFNGAAFENLTVTKAEGYIAKTDEISKAEYGAPKTELEYGKTYDLTLAGGGSDLVDYTILGNLIATSYSAKNGKDVYNFNFNQYGSGDYKPVDAVPLSGVAKEYQDTIDELGDVTEDNVFDRKADIWAVAAMYGEDANHTGSTVKEDKYRNVLDFAPYLAAQETLKKAAPLDADGQKFVDDLKSMQNLNTYVMKGWKAAAGATDTTGFLYNDYEKTKQLITKYDALPAQMQEFVFYHVQESLYTNWKQFATDLAAEEAKEIYTTAEKLTAYSLTDGTKLEKDPDGVMAQIAYWMLQIKNGGKWDGTADLVMNFDNSFKQSEYIIICVDYLKGLGISLPTYYEDTLAAIGYEAFEPNYRALQATIAIGSFWQTTTDNLTVKNEITQAQAELLTRYFGADWKYTDAGIVWNYKDTGAMDARLSNTLKYHLTKDTTFNSFGQCVAKIKEVLESHGYVLVDGKFPTVTANTIEAKAGVSLSLDDLTADGLAFYNDWNNNVGKLATFKMDGWKKENPEAANTGKLYDTMMAIPGYKTRFEALSEADQKTISGVLRYDVAEELAVWTELKAEYEALLSNETFSADTKFEFVSAKLTDTKVQQTAEGIFIQIAYWSFQIKNGAKGLDPSAGKLEVMDGDNSWWESTYIVQLVKKFDELGLTLPKFLIDRTDAENPTGILADIKYDRFAEAYDSIFTTVALAQRIKTENITALSALTEEELAILNAYWVKGHEINSILKWNWNSGAKFETYMSARVKRIVTIAGGTLKGTDGTTALKCFEYFQIVADFLTANGYTVNANGWGVTAETIAVPAA